MFKLSGRNLFLLLLFCVPNTFLSIGILVIMNNIVSGKTILFNSNQGIIFFSMVAVSFLLNIFFQKKITAYSNRLIYENELHIMEKFLSATPAQLEKVGSQRIYGAIEDMRMLVQLPGMISTGITLLLTLIICLAYFALLSVPATLFVMGLIALTVFVYLSVHKSVSGRMHHLRKLNDTYFKLVDDIIKGFKELKLSVQRRSNLRTKFLQPNRAEARDMDTHVSNYLSVINLLSQYGLYIIIGVVIFVLPQMNLLNKAQISAFVVILLFIRGPINALTGMQAFFTKAFSANKRIKGFLGELHSLSTPDEDDVNAGATNEVIEELRFENISYKYATAGAEDTYALRNVNLTVQKGEVIFIIGGNGSGKSTFVNILTGINAPLRGKVYLNGQVVASNTQHYRNHIAAIFSENHLFSENFEDYSLENNETYKTLLKVMELDKVVTDDQDASARRRFSKGQGKRMAMIFALLEKKPILVLDEWAADQDPHFRKYFYQVLIPKMRREGKTIIAVTHDDAYFQVADRIVKFEYGQIVQDAPARKRILDLS